MTLCLCMYSRLRSCGCRQSEEQLYAAIIRGDIIFDAEEWDGVSEEAKVLPCECMSANVDMCSAIQRSFMRAHVRVQLCLQTCNWLPACLSACPVDCELRQCMQTKVVGKRVTGKGRESWA